MLFVILISLALATSSMAMKGMDHGGESKEMEHGSENMDGAFKYTAMADGVHTEFQVMDLASMNMQDPEGKTHHVMGTFKRDDQVITTAVGKIKLISPTGKEQIASLQDYGSGIFAANFTIDEPGKWGVICLFKDAEGQHTVKFWYSHMSM